MTTKQIVSRILKDMRETLAEGKDDKFFEIDGHTLCVCYHAESPEAPFFVTENIYGHFRITDYSTEIENELIPDLLECACGIDLSAHVLDSYLKGDITIFQAWDIIKIIK